MAHADACLFEDGFDVGERLAGLLLDAEFFTEPYPARSAVAVKSLPKGASVEIEVVAAIE